MHEYIRIYPQPQENIWSCSMRFKPWGRKMVLLEISLLLGGYLITTIKSISRVGYFSFLPCYTGLVALKYQITLITKMLTKWVFQLFLTYVAEKFYLLQNVLLNHRYIFISWKYYLIIKYIGKDDNENIYN